MSILKERFPFWGLDLRRVDGERLAYSAWFWALGAVVVGAGVYLLFGMIKPGAQVYAGLGALVLAHLQARAWIGRSLPNISFERDRQTGNLEQLRLLPWTAHELLFHRYFPAFYMRWIPQILWLPLYTLWSFLAGLGIWDGLALWGLVGFASYPALTLTSFYLLIPFGWFDWGFVFGLGLLAYAFMGEKKQAQFSGSSSWLIGLLVTLPIFLRLLMPTSLMMTMPEIVPFAVLWLIVEALRWERRARWLNPPTGLGRLWGWFASGALFGFVAWNMASASALVGAMGAGQLEAVSVALFASAGYVSLLWLPLERGRDQVSHRWRTHLIETAGLRLWSLVMLTISALLIRSSASLSAYWALFGVLNVLEIVIGSYSRYAYQQMWARRQSMVWNAVIVGLSPALTAPITLGTSGIEWIALFSPTIALWMQTSFGGTNPSLIWTGVLLTARYALSLLGFWWVLSHNRLSTLLRYLDKIPRMLGWLFGYAFYDNVVRYFASNPVLLLLMRERRSEIAPMIAFCMACVGLLSGSGEFLGIALLGHLPLGAWLWYWGYSVAHRTVRKLIDSGELCQWFLANVAPRMLFWGIVQASWYLQGRLVVAYWGGLVVGILARAVWEQPINIWVVPAAIGFVPLWGALVLIWSCVWFISAPNGIRDALAMDVRHGGVPMVQVGLKSLLMSGISCTCVLAPLLLLGLPLYYSQSVQVLARLSRASPPA